MVALAVLRPARDWSTIRIAISRPCDATSYLGDVSGSMSKFDTTVVFKASNAHIQGFDDKVLAEA